jgi:hypothetical protein
MGNSVSSPGTAMLVACMLYPLIFAGVPVRDRFDIQLCRRLEGHFSVAVPTRDYENLFANGFVDAAARCY